jgi:metal-responsive CopG/Arc/MetJ family transcriptional regulator
VKTAVSLPDELFARAELAARRLRVSRSELYARAIAEFLQLQKDMSITERLNEVYSTDPASIDPVLAQAQSDSIEHEKW